MFHPTPRCALCCPHSSCCFSFIVYRSLMALRLLSLPRSFPNPLRLSPPQEDSHRGKPQWEHLSDELHVLVQVEDSENRARIKIRRAARAIDKFLHNAAHTVCNAHFLHCFEPLLYSPSCNRHFICISVSLISEFL